MAEGDGRMPLVAEFQGIGIHDFQPESRIREVVIPEIKHVMALDDADTLVAYLKDITRPPEARLAAEKKLLEPADEAQANRRKAKVDPTIIRAMAAGLNSLRWADPDHYTTVLHPWGPHDPQPARRDPENAARVREAKVRAR